MGSAAAKAEISRESARRHNRMALSVPVSLTLSRSGASEFIPARALNVSEGGLSTILAGEIFPFELVGVEFKLPDVGIPLRAKAWVRYQSALRCGLEFTGLSLQQRSMIRYWLQRSAEDSKIEILPKMEDDVAVESLPKSPDVRSLKRLFWVLGCMIAILSLSLVGWYWQSQWTKLETGIPSIQQDGSNAVVVPAADMEKLVVHQVDPVYPDAARQSGLSGIVKLSVVVEPDGTVSSVTPLSGATIFQSAAVDAMRWWRFRSYVVDGKPVRVQTSLALEFKP